MNVRDVYSIFWNLNSHLNKLLISIDYLQLIIDHDENEEIFDFLAPHIGRLIVNSWDEIDLQRFSNLFSLTLTRPSPMQLKQIQADTMPKITFLSLCSNMYISLPKQLIYDVFSNRFSHLRWARLGRIDTFDSLLWSQSFSLRHLHIDCSHPTMIPFILTSCPNLDHLHIDFLRYSDKLILPSPVILNHPLRKFILRDYCHLISYDDIRMLIIFIPNTTKIELKFFCNTSFIILIQYLCIHLAQLQRFDCEIVEYPIDSTTSITTIRQVHPSFNHIALTALFQEEDMCSAATKASAELATFGAGCFWGTEKFFRKQFGNNLLSAVVGYMGGASKASYEDVCKGTTNHAEVLQVSYDPNKVVYADLVRFFFRMHDSTTLNRQGNDRGTQYRSVIFTHTNEQQKTAEQVRDEVQASGKVKGQIVTQIEPVNGLKFFEGEPYHQRYLEENPDGYCNHRLYF
ncbi:hypothetical protein I4U23_020248 [Adineta vaga]|nr:hypothetical protein I4U23_020248 [Adineta vaga]